MNLILLTHDKVMIELKQLHLEISKPNLLEDKFV